MRNAATLLLFLLLLPATAFAGRVERELSAAALAGSARRVIVDIPAGKIRVRNGAPGRISVSGVVSRQPDGPRSRDAEQRIVDDSGLAMSVRGENMTIRRTFGPNAKSWRAGTFSDWDVTVEVPPGLHVDIRTRYGAVDVKGTFGDIDVDLTAGEVDVEVPRSIVRELRASCLAGEVHTDLGDEVVRREGLFPGKTRYVNAAGTTLLNLHTTFGEVKVDLK